MSVHNHRAGMPYPRKTPASRVDEERAGAVGAGLPQSQSDTREWSSCKAGPMDDTLVSAHHGVTVPTSMSDSDSDALVPPSPVGISDRSKHRTPVPVLPPKSPRRYTSRSNPSLSGPSSPTQTPPPVPTRRQYTLSRTNSNASSTKDLIPDRTSSLPGATYSLYGKDDSIRSAASSVSDISKSEQIGSGLNMTHPDPSRDVSNAILPSPVSPYEEFVTPPLISPSSDSPSRMGLRSNLASSPTPSWSSKQSMPVSTGLSTDLTVPTFSGSPPYLSGLAITSSSAALPRQHTRRNTNGSAGDDGEQTFVQSDNYDYKTYMVPRSPTSSSMLASSPSSSSQTTASIRRIPSPIQNSRRHSKSSLYRGSASNPSSPTPHSFPAFAAPVDPSNREAASDNSDLDTTLASLHQGTSRVTSTLRRSSAQRRSSSTYSTSPATPTLIGGLQLPTVSANPYSHSPPLSTSPSYMSTSPSTSPKLRATRLSSIESVSGVPAYAKSPHRREARRRRNSSLERLKHTSPQPKLPELDDGSSVSRPGSSSAFSQTSRTRTSLATSLATFEFEPEDSDQQARTQHSPAQSSSQPQPQPQPVRSVEGHPHAVSPTLQAPSAYENDSASPRSRPHDLARDSLSSMESQQVYRGSRVDSLFTPTWGLPSMPERTTESPTDEKSFPQTRDEDQLQPPSHPNDTYNRWSLSSMEADVSDVGESEAPSSPHSFVGPTVSRRDVGLGLDSERRVARMFGSTSTARGYMFDELKTPRGSVSKQGEQSNTHSVYSQGGASSVYSDDLAQNADFPSWYSARSRDSGPLPPIPTLQEGDLHLDLNANDQASERDLDETYTPSDLDDSQQNRLFLGPLGQSLDSLSVSDQDRTLQKRKRVIDELVDTEKSYAQDLAVTRDIWLARARGKELAEIMTNLQSRAWTIPLSPYPGGSDGFTSGGEVTSSPACETPPVFNRSVSSASASSMFLNSSGAPPPLVNQPSSSSMRSLKGLPNLFGNSRSSTSLKDANSEASNRWSSSTGDRRSTEPIRPTVHRSTSGTSVLSRPVSSQSTSLGSSLNAVMSSSDVRVIFNNLEDITSFTETFIHVLEAASGSSDDKEQKMSDTYGEAFLSIIPRLEEVYSIYCSRFGAAIARYEEVASRLKQYNSECKELSQGLTNAWDLPSLLIKPVQRCLKYPLLLQGLLERTPKEHPDRAALAEAAKKVIDVAEKINELKRRQEMVGRIVKPRVRSDSHARSIRKAGSAPAKQRSASATSEAANTSTTSLTSSVSMRFKRQTSKVKTALTPPAEPVPASDPTFDALVSAMERRQEAIQAFILNAKAWSRSVRLSMVSLLQFSLVWKSLYIGIPEDAQAFSRSARTIEHFAEAIVKRFLEGPWLDLDREIKQHLAPKVSELLDLFRNPCAVIARRNAKQACCRQPPSAKADKHLKENATAYHALNAQLLAELPTFLHAVDTYFSAIFARFITLQTAVFRTLSETWTEYARQCCTQLGPPSQTPGDNMKAWWQIHKPIVDRFDSLRVLSADSILKDLERNRRNALPASLRSRVASTPSPMRGTPEYTNPVPRGLTRQISSPKIIQDGTHISPSNGTYIDESARGDSSFLSVSRNVSPSFGSGENRTSVISASSNGSLAFSSHTASSVPFPSTPLLETLPFLWKGATTTRYIATLGKPPSPTSNYPYINCEVGDLVDVLEESPHQDFALVKKEGAQEMGWLPLGILRKLE